MLGLEVEDYLAFDYVRANVEVLQVDLAQWLFFELFGFHVDHFYGLVRGLIEVEVGRQVGIEDLRADLYLI